jgi:hypothetical protein
VSGSLYKGSLDAIRTIAKQEGAGAFYKGLSSALLGSGEYFFFLNPLLGVVRM